MSALSAVRIQKPEQIFIWYDTLPVGAYWNDLTQEISKSKIELVFKMIEAPKTIFNITINWQEHKSDIQRMRALYEFGGIYMDLDVIILKSFLPIMCFELTLGQETSNKLNNGIIVASRQSQFVDNWYDNYRAHKHDAWSYHNLRLPFKLAERHRSLIHTEHTTMNRPSWSAEERKYLYSGKLKYDWSRNYCIHTWYRFHQIEYDPDSIKTINKTTGELFRFVLFGSLEI